jgi:altronate dehydratase large subunit
MLGYQRKDGRKGIRNRAILVALGEGARPVARDIVRPHRRAGAEAIGYPGARLDDHVTCVLERVVQHPNVGAVLVLDERGSPEAHHLVETARASSRRADIIDLRSAGSRAAAIAAGRGWIAGALEDLRRAGRVPLAPSDLIVGTICGGSDATSALSANPGIGLVYDRLAREGATLIFEETGELIGCDHLLAARASNPAVARAILAAMAKATRFYAALGHGSFAPGNAEGGLTTIEEKSLGAYAKSGSGPIAGVVRPGEQPGAPGLYLMDKVPDGPVRHGYSDATDNVGVAEMIACGAQLILFSTGRGSVVGSAVAPVIKICANPETYRALVDDMDVDAGRVLEDRGSLADVAAELHDLVHKVVSGEQPKSERLGHQEFLITRKSIARPKSAA